MEAEQAKRDFPQRGQIWQITAPVSPNARKTTERKRRANCTNWIPPLHSATREFHKEVRFVKTTAPMCSTARRMFMVASPTSRSEPQTSRTRHSSQEVKPATGQGPHWIQGMPLTALRFMSKRGGNCVWRASCNNLGRVGIRNREGRTTSETVQFEKSACQKMKMSISDTMVGPTERLVSEAMTECGWFP